MVVGCDDCVCHRLFVLIDVSQYTNNNPFAFTSVSYLIFRKFIVRHAKRIFRIHVRIQSNMYCMYIPNESHVKTFVTTKYFPFRFFFLFLSMISVLDRMDTFLPCYIHVSSLRIAEIVILLLFI